MPKKLETLPVPADEGCRLDDGDGVVPVEKAAQPDYREAGSVDRATRLGPVLHKEPDLASQEDVSGGKGGLWF